MILKGGRVFFDGADGGYWVNIFACRRVFSIISGMGVLPKPPLAGLIVVLGHWVH